MSIIGSVLQTPEHENPLVSFYRSKTPDTTGRYISQILKWDCRKLEDTHDYIQWLFPLPEESMVSSAPLVDADVFNAFQSSPELQSLLKNSLVKMLDFYGFEFVDGLNENNNLPTIVRSPSFTAKCGNWLVRRDHNHLRISRILRSLRVLGLEPEAAALYKAISDIIYAEPIQIVSSQSAEFWRRAAQRPLHWAPHLPEKECRMDRKWRLGAEFLKDYERIKMARELQQRHDTKKALEEEKEAEFQATKAHIAAVMADRQRRFEEANVSSQKPGRVSLWSRSSISEPQLDKKEDVVAQTRELVSDVQEVIATEAIATPKSTDRFSDATNFDEPMPRLDKPELINQKAAENGGQSATHKIQQYQLMSPRHP
ncbi:a5120602-3a92-494b-8a01-d384c48cc083 [Sclerotinia trifoliorum]|uniref:A5120602-3a92-494b-8a01-d384c48cc083 n=1 Tax=Sclerotinia trifoliorum TaxID=28548 RepID=A0A8H2VQ32_9HELO|nr:a5120602-3a92-494b-8a01-d384c48cc083 [Sclerotinia trifoliorum]